MYRSADQSNTGGYTLENDQPEPTKRFRTCQGGGRGISSKPMCQNIMNSSSVFNRDQLLESLAYRESMIPSTNLSATGSDRVIDGFLTASLDLSTGGKMGTVEFSLPYGNTCQNVVGKPAFGNFVFQPAQQGPVGAYHVSERRSSKSEILNKDVQRSQNEGDSVQDGPKHLRDDSQSSNKGPGSGLTYGSPQETHRKIVLDNSWNHEQYLNEGLRKTPDFNGSSKPYLSYRKQWEQLRSTPSHGIIASPGKVGFATPPTNQRTFSRQGSLKFVLPSDVGTNSRQDFSPSVSSTTAICSPRFISTPVNSSKNLQSHELGLSRHSAETNTMSVSASESDPKHRIPHSKQNGNVGTLRIPTDGSSSLRGRMRKIKFYGKDYGVHNSLVGLAFLAILSLIMCFLGLQLLLRLANMTPSLVGVVLVDSLLASNLSYVVVREITVALSSVVLMLNLWCLLTCSLQCYFGAKLVKCTHGEERAFDFIKVCTVSRVTSTIGFFISIPILLLALVLYVILEYSFIPSVVCVIILTSGIVCIFATLIQNIYHWWKENSRAGVKIRLPSMERSRKRVHSEDEPVPKDRELSTLV